MDSESRPEEANADSAPEHRSLNRKERRLLKREVRRQKRRTMRALHRELKSMRLASGVAPWRIEDDTLMEDLLSDPPERQPDPSEGSDTP